MTIEMYVLIDRDGLSLDAVFDDFEEAENAAGSEYAVVARIFEYSDSELVYTPDGSMTWPPNGSHAGEA